MCGLAGVLTLPGGKPVEATTLVAMRDAMLARGPDGEGLWVALDGRVGLAHRRLAIQDLSEHGAQPMLSADGSLVVAFNGEIYNHPELRKRCESRGARYRSNSDTETLLHLYEQEGEDFVKSLRGMFAFALWDTRQRKLVLARDPFGIKPLYCSNFQGQFRFASQVKSLLAGGVPGEVDPAGLASFLTWGYVTEPFTWFKSVQPIAAGSMVVVDSDGAISETRFSAPLDVLRGAEPITRSGDLRAALRDSVRHHLLADVPIGVFLSAGIDSGTLLALMREVAPETQIHAVTLGFEEFRGTAADETLAAADVAKRFNVEHTTLTYTSEDFTRCATHLFNAMDQPSVDGVNTFFVSKASADAGLKVAFSGVGGDELFGGYPSFRQVPSLAARLGGVSPKLGRGIRGALEPIVRAVTSPKYAGLFEYGGSVPGAYLLRRALFMPWELPALIGEDLAREGLERLNLLESLSAITQDISSDYHKVMALEYDVYMRNCLLRDSDWAGMAHSVEIRTPLVDSVLFAQVGTLETSSGRAAKFDFVNAPATPLLQHEQARRKTGFNVPFKQWMLKTYGSKERGLRGWARHVLQANGLKSV